MKKLVVALMVAGVLAVATPFVILWAGPAPTVAFDPPPKAVGPGGEVRVKQEAAATLSGRLEQAGNRIPLTGHGPAAFRLPQQGLKDGKARLVVEASRHFGYARRTTRAEQEVEVVTQPPRVVADGHQHYINQGGSELVTFTPSGNWTEAGVRVGQHAFRGFPLPGRPGEYFSLFAHAWDLAPDAVPKVYARNNAGTEAQAQFWFKTFPKKFRVRDLVIDGRFMDKVVNQIDPGSSGDLLSRFLKINGEMRRANNQTLSELRHQTEQRVLWNGPFIHLGKEESNFADVRNYIYNGKKVDQQVHLGFDLSDVQNAPVMAGNAGKVIFAQNLGIYGNCIVLDHGYGLQSIYGHLSRFEVKPGEMVKKGQTMGRSGQTGLAGGDHVHFSMQVDGVQVTPIEWWDAHWIQDRVLSKLPK